MKKILLFFIVTFLIFTICGCTFIEKTLFPDKKNGKEGFVDFKVEKIALSKGFQSTEPNVEVVKKDNSNKLLASLGLVEGSGAEIDKITKWGNEITIYTNLLSEKKDTELTVPQILFEIEDLDIENLEDLNFNIIKQNYETIPLKFNKGQILKNVYSEFKITPNTIPNVDLTKSGEKMFWIIDFQSIFDKEEPNMPLINFDIKVDANTGEILNSKKENISTYIDEGILLDYIPNTHLLYKKQEVKNDTEYEHLIIYNIETKKQKKLYTSNRTISSASFSPDNENISLIETDGNKSDIYIIPKFDELPYKVTPADYLQPKLVKWEDNSNLYFLNVSETSSTLLKYNVDENKSKMTFATGKIMEDFDILKDKLLFTEVDEDSINKSIYISEDNKTLKEIGIGFKAQFFNNNSILFLNNIDKKDKNALHTYSLEKKFDVKDSEFNIQNYYKVDEDNIIFIEKNTCNNNYTLNNYNMTEKKIEPIASIIDDKIYYDQDNNIGYMSLDQPDDNKEQNIIYSIDLDKLNVLNN